MRTVIFDLDGTLADTSADLLAAANTALQELGHAPQLEPGRDDLTAFAGGRAMLKLGLERLGHSAPEAEIERGYPLLLAAYGREIDRYTRLYPGAVEAVEALRADGVAVGICTNKPEALARDLLERLGIDGLFASLIGADTLPVRKPDPTPYRRSVELAGGALQRSCLIGDTITDRDTARAAGVPCVLVGFGPWGEGVSELQPEAILHNYAELPALAARLLGADSA